MQQNENSVASVMTLYASGSAGGRRKIPSIALSASPTCGFEVVRYNILDVQGIQYK